MSHSGFGQAALFFYTTETVNHILITICGQDKSVSDEVSQCHRYQSWSETVGKATASVAVLYSSDYGYSDRLSQTLARGITKTGAATEMVDVLSVDAQVSNKPTTVTRTC